MEVHGKILQAYIEQNAIKPVRIYKAMDISKQAFYQLYKSKVFEESTIQNIETALGLPWSEIKKVNIDSSSNVRKVLSHEEWSKKDSLEKSIENLTQNELRTTAIIERLVTLLEDNYNSLNPMLPKKGMPQTETGGRKKTGHKKSG